MQRKTLEERTQERKELCRQLDLIVRYFGNEYRYYLGNGVAITHVFVDLETLYYTFNIYDVNGSAVVCFVDIDNELKKIIENKLIAKYYPEVINIIANNNKYFMDKLSKEENAEA